MTKKKAEQQAPASPHRVVDPQAERDRASANSTPADKPKKTKKTATRRK